MGEIVDIATRPIEPELRVVQRARVVLRYYEAGQMVECADDGWARIDGAWLLFCPDEPDLDGWQSWPARNVLAVYWTAEGDDG